MPVLKVMRNGEAISATWFELQIGPGWEVDKTKPDRMAFKRHTDNSDGSHDDETAILNADGTSTFTKSHVVDTTPIETPQRTTRDTEMTFTTHDVDGAVLKQSSEFTRESINEHGGRNWSTTISDGDGNITATQRGFTFEGPHGGDQTVITERLDNGTKRTDNVTWTGRGAQRRHKAEHRDR